MDINRLTIAEVREQEFLDYMNATSQVKPISTVYLDTVEGGRIEEINIDEGAMVRKGDGILILSNPDLNLRILNNQASLAEQENRLRDTKLLMEQQRIEFQRHKLFNLIMISFIWKETLKRIITRAACIKITVNCSLPVHYYEKNSSLGFGLFILNNWGLYH